MTRLHSQLKYFLNSKISEDSSWANVQVILSGHDVPGEGEHKIMDYIRLSKSQTDYNPNTRHCLYGLDADLMMLGLVTHEPHFSLLREEVTFGRKKKPEKSVDRQTFYLFHLSLFREYLNLEFIELKNRLSFPYDLERIIDDYVLMCYFIGNDFLPHISGFDINSGAISTMFRIYKELLPKMSGYMNESGKLNLECCEAFLVQMGEIELSQFKESLGDMSWLANKREEQSSNSPKTASSPGKQCLSI